MGCVNCTQAIKEENEKKFKVVEEAQKRSNESGEWFAIYYEQSTGERKCIRADLAAGLPIEQYVSPKLQDFNV